MKESINRIGRAFQHKNEIIERQQEEIVLLRHRIGELFTSFSWRITAPLRRVHSMLTGTPAAQPLPPPPSISPGDTTVPELNELLRQLTMIQAVTPAPAASLKTPPPTPAPEEHSSVPAAWLERETMLDFLIFPIIDWDFRFQRPQQIAVRLARAGNRIFYFKTTFNRFTDHVTKDHLEIREIEKNIYQVKLATRDPLNIYRDLVHGRPQMSDLLASLGVLKRLFGISHTVSVIDHPFWWPLARSLKNNLNVYDCMDDHSGFDNNMNITTYEPALIIESDLVVVSSEILLRNVKPHARRIIQVKNGTDFNHFNNLPESDVLAGDGRPVIGYYGAIAEWFDVDLMEACIKAFPQYRFVLIGRVTNKDIPRLQGYENVVMPGEIPYKDLPQYVKYFDVCLIPFRLTKLIEATNPVKFYEYLSSGKPLVSVMLPELMPYSDLCYLASSAPEFIRHIKAALQEKDQKGARIELARQNSWEQRCQAFLKGVHELFPKVSILIVTYHNLHLTRLCYESIRKYTRYPNIEIIFIDNGSTDGTPAWLRETAAGDPSVKVILNGKNRGFAGANNQGMEAVSGEYVVYLNNDTIVTNHWLESLLRHLQDDPTIGLICPATNETGNEACVRITYQNIGGIQPFAFEFAGGRYGMHRRIRTVPLYCAMIRADLLRKIDGLNEEYAIGMFEDDDLSEQIQALGYRTVYAEDTFIHHFGRASFKKIPKPEYDDLFRKNKAIFEKKWGKYVPHIRGWFNPPVEIPVVEERAN